MANKTIKITLSELNGAQVFNAKNGKKYIAIPVTDNDAIYEGKKGIYMTFVAIERKEVAEDGQTHFLKELISKEKFGTMTQEQKSQLSIVGSLVDNDLLFKQRAETKKAQEPTPIEGDDLPF